MSENTMFVETFVYEAAKRLMPVLKIWEERVEGACWFKHGTTTEEEIRNKLREILHDVMNAPVRDDDYAYFISTGGFAIERFLDCGVVGYKVTHNVLEDFEIFENDEHQEDIEFYKNKVADLERELEELKLDKKLDDIYGDDFCEICKYVCNGRQCLCPNATACSAEINKRKYS